MAKRYNTRPGAAVCAHESVGSDLLDEAYRRLRGAGYAGFKHIQCAMDDGVLTLRGTVASYYLKQRAFHVVAGLNGVQRVSNEIAVDGSWA